MKKVITPVGTSLLMNYKDKNKNMIDAELRSLQDHEKRDKSAEEWENCSSAIKKIKDKVAPWAKKKLNAGDVTASAEITSLVKIMEKVNDDVEAHLLATDTVISRLAAEIIAAVLNEFRHERGQTFTVSFVPADDVIRGLQVNNQTRFEKEGMAELIRRIEQITGEYYENVAIDMTGGYKATIPYLTLIGQLKNVPLYYTFDEPPYQLITIPQAPIAINWGMFEKFSHIFRQLSEGVAESWDDFRRKNNVQEDFSTCVYEDAVDNVPLIGLNAIGEIFWKQYQHFFTVRLQIGGKYFYEDATKKRELNNAFQELYRRLSSMTVPLKTLINADLKKTVIEDTLVYKHTSPQIRIQYGFDEERKQLTIFNYVYRADHPDYSDIMKREYAEIKHDMAHGNVTIITLRKEF